MLRDSTPGGRVALCAQHAHGYFFCKFGKLYVAFF